MVLEVCKADDVQSTFVGGFQYHGRGVARFGGFVPSGCAKAPAVARGKPRESVFRSWCAEIVAPGEREREELLGHHGAHGMTANIFWPGFTAAAAGEAGDGVCAAG